MDLLSQLDWRAYLFAMIIIELTPGPNMGWLTALSAQHGLRVGLVAVAGVTLGLAIQMLAAATGLSALISGFPILYEALRWAGVAFMIWLAWLAFSENRAPVPDPDLNEKSFRRGLVANLLNPKALVFYFVVIGQFTNPELGALWWQVILLGSMHLMIAVTVHVLIISAGASLGQAIDEWRTSLPARLFFALSLLIVALWIAVSTS
jgi:threonine/homoserine/homoserine lactone efflux protein